jgi:hypothetical protein
VVSLREVQRQAEKVCHVGRLHLGCIEIALSQVLDEQAGRPPIHRPLLNASFYKVLLESLQ